MDLIISHAGCPDGWAAAYTCKLKYPEADIVLLNHGLTEDALDDLFAKIDNKDVIMVDYSLRTRELNDKLAALSNTFRILDHHKTAQAVLEGAPYAIFDMKRSGAGMAWDYLFGKDAFLEGDGYQERPFWISFTEDQDLWNWTLPNSELVNAFLMVQPRTVEFWNDLIKRHDVTSATEAGIGTRAYIEYYTRSVLAEAQGGTFHGHRSGVLNIPYVGVSEAGNALCKAGYPLAVLWFERGDGQTQFSLRGDGSIDVSAIAKIYGGGGHANAAGFQVSNEQGRNIVDTILGRLR